ncbi:PilN domain-containing protein [uncultured Desulfuromusa sp.]|uniref:PilN domain-containing protein n=1 Tax=uncultured Desulfuromusa sp. TaxID=219183 RepID=UPI002AA6C7B0|nr:PilN domain-containing protein [uncultured Desulfuromusa sp.]
MKLLINLASERHLNQLAVRLTLSVFMVLLLLVLAIEGSTYLKCRQLAQQYQTHLDALQEQLRGKQPQRLSAEELAEQQQAYHQAELLLQRDAFRWTVLFDRIEGLLPDGVSLRSFNPDYGKNSLLVTGVARNLPNLQELLDHFQAEAFHQVYLKNQVEVDVDDGHGGKRSALSFSLSVEGVF